MMQSYPQKTLEGVLLIIDHPESVSLKAVKDEKDEKIIGFCGACCTAPDVYVMVHYFVSPAERGQGVGTSLWQKVREQIPRGSNVFLWGYDSVLDLYRSAGFRYEGPGGHVYTGVPNRDVISTRSRRNSNPFDTAFISVDPYTPDTREQLLAYDDVISPVPRHDFLERFLKMASHILVATKDERVVGYVAAIPLQYHYYEIAPLYAEDEEVASRLVETLLGSIPEDSMIYVSSLADSKEGASLWDKLGLSGAGKQPLFQGRQMSTSKTYDLPSQKIYALCTAEFSIV